MKIGIVGSINIDLMLKLNNFMSKGQTAFTENFDLKMGGKGANQAVMLSAINDNVSFCGAVGNDVYATSLINYFNKKGLKTDFIFKKKSNTGLAIVQIVKQDNSIAVVPGANNLITKNDIDKFLNGNPDLKVVVSQLEINFTAVEYLIEKCSKKGIPIILNPAPGKKISKSLISKVDYLIPNETEASLIFGSQDFNKLISNYKEKLIITLGSKGVLYYNQKKKKAELIPAKKINVIDTTGAGDSFVAGFASGIVKGSTVAESIKLGIEIASLTCQALGAQGAYNLVKNKYKSKRK
jgi:ribokinase